MESESKVSRSIRPRQARLLLGGISNTTLWRWVRERPDFPRPTRLGPRTTVFQLDDLLAFRNRQSEGTAEVASS